MFHAAFEAKMAEEARQYCEVAERSCGRRPCGAAQRLSEKVRCAAAVKAWG